MNSILNFFLHKNLQKRRKTGLRQLPDDFWYPYHSMTGSVRRRNEGEHCGLIRKIPKSRFHDWFCDGKPDVQVPRSLVCSIEATTLAEHIETLDESA